MFSRQKTQNQQFQINRKTAYIFTILSYFSFKISCSWELRGWKHLHVAQPLPRISLLSHFWTTLCMRAMLKAAILVLQEYSDIFPSCYLVHGPQSLDSNFSLRAPLFMLLVLCIGSFVSPLLLSVGLLLYQPHIYTAMPTQHI